MLETFESTSVTCCSRIWLTTMRRARTYPWARMRPQTRYPSRIYSWAMRLDDWLSPLLFHLVCHPKEPWEFWNRFMWAARDFIFDHFAVKLFGLGFIVVIPYVLGALFGRAERIAGEFVNIAIVFPLPPLLLVTSHVKAGLSMSPWLRVFSSSNSRCSFVFGERSAHHVLVR